MERIASSFFRTVDSTLRKTTGYETAIQGDAKLANHLQGVGAPGIAARVIG
jgi:hypothetical protein